jgi:hypothetical protein
MSKKTYLTKQISNKYNVDSMLTSIDSNPLKTHRVPSAVEDEKIVNSNLLKYKKKYNSKNLKNLSNFHKSSVDDNNGKHIN